MRTKRPALLAGALTAVVLLAACEGAIERNAASRLAPASPSGDAGLRDLARSHSEASCAAGQVLVTDDPSEAYGPGTIELSDREPLDPTKEAPADDHAATSAIWQRFRADPRLDDTSWDLMGAGQARCDDGNLYMTLLLQDDASSDDPAPGLRRVTAGDAPTLLGGISADGSTVALRSRATNLAPGATAPDIWLYDVTADELTATGVEPRDNTRGVVLSGDGSTVFYDDIVDHEELIDAHAIEALDVATGATRNVTGFSFAPVSVTSASADGGVVTYEQFGAGGRDLLARIGARVRGVGDLDGFSYESSVSDDGRWVLWAGGGVRVLDLDTSAVSEIAPGDDCISENVPASGTSVSADGGAVAYSCLQLSGDRDGRQDLRVWDRATGTSRRLTSDEDRRGTRGAPSISDDGRFVAFVYERPDLPSGVATYVWDRTTDRSTFVAPFGSKVAISGDGTTLALAAVAPGQTNTAITDLYIWDNPAA